MFYVIVILAAIFGVPAKADEVLKWRHVQHAVSNQTQQIGDHTISLYRIIGLALFPDGSTARMLAAGSTDFSGSEGTPNGYQIFSFNDGSELTIKFTGTSKLGSPVVLKGTGIVIGGKGRYAGAKGDGTWEGQGATTPGPESMTYIDNVYNIKQ
jgi:hypothetical protein